MVGDHKSSEIPSIMPRSPPPRRSLPILAKRQPLKKTRDLPDIFYCHGCGHRFPSDGPIDRLHPLPSQWRVVLLCRSCLGIVNSGSCCSYCFSPFISPAQEDSLGTRTCRRCRCRVHLACVPHQRGFVSLAELDPDSFTCIDCCAVPKFKFRNPRVSSNDQIFSRFSLEDLVKDAEKKAEDAVKAKDKALKKAVAAKCAAEKAKNALGVLLVSNGPSKAVTEEGLNDEELALRLHLAMNGSQRLSRSLRPRNSGGLSDAKRSRRGIDSDSGRVCGKVELCTEDNKFFESMENSRLDCKKTEQEEVAETSENKTVALVMMDEETCSNMINGNEKPAGWNGIQISPEGGGHGGEDSAESLRMKRSSSPQRYMKKYSKRNSKGVVDRKEKLGVNCDGEGAKMYNEPPNGDHTN
ncbi:hypothetical protein J5N97_020730 [Dioscorea zingiberensis]|uniref:Uncharacterized protein n=1 Tax=Dioscorea zingiberensis TaxID=325984 RepID=A0A9D5CGC4_9LILI|nr:hypothetical protein J5N97_020730 [Dioscorea zingiberensis]